MADKELCVFCGRELSLLSNDFFQCGKTYQPACRECWKKLAKASELERCRLALESGRANEPERVKALYDELRWRDEVRLRCLRCGVKMTYGEVIMLDKSPFTESIFLGGYMEVRPLVCERCGKIEFYEPKTLRQWEERAIVEMKDGEDEK